MSLALKHKRRVLAGGSAVSSAPVAQPYTAANALSSPANAQKHLKLMEAALARDLERISEINSRELRQQLKRDELLPKYLEYVQRYRESGLNYPNAVVMQVLVWLFDTAQFEAGLELADFAIEQGQQLPERFKRDVQTFVADELIDWAEAEHKAGRSPEPYVSNLLPRVDAGWDDKIYGPENPAPEAWELFERIPARYHKLLGVLAMDRKDWATAVQHLNRATDLYPEIGVKTRLEGAEKALRKQLAEGATE
ncbi:phage terminase small subunit [Stutzerimonas nitrititolerans]|uniref:phage terminase small subunit n=1 Tax=Stutzerimonas nitrititolerans TaxID=2482751 RepID=UPI001BDCF914|nr:phage terminase small subunit [Stutzerimonas nitrititolerans]MBT1120749.1 terminase [Stutzerimonas nitrititolerans]